MILLIDNYDSFTYNIYQYLRKLNHQVLVRRNDEILHQIVEGKIVPPRKIDPAYDEALERIVLRALERQPDKRYQTAHDLQMALEAFARERGFFLSTTGLKRLMEDLFGRKLDAWREAGVTTLLAKAKDVRTVRALAEAAA